MKRLVLSLISILMLISVNGCVSHTLNQAQLSKFDKDVNVYKENTKYHKAMAVAMDANGKYAFGRSWGFSLQSQANKRAIDECQKSRRRYNVKSKCEIYMIDDNVVRNL